MIREVDPRTLTIHPHNPRRGDVRAITRSIRANGWFGAVVVQESTGYVLVGNHRVQAAVAAELDSIPVMFLNVDDEQAKRILLADNRASDMGTYDYEVLGELLDKLLDEDLPGSLWTDSERAAFTLRHLDREREQGYGNVGDAPTPGERRAGYEASGVRTIILSLPQDEYLRVKDRLRELQEASGAETTGEVLMSLLGVTA